jgi:biopolymer transport protein ExbD
MSHGPTSEGSSAEPNLTPLLDVVLQLLMFFMMCVNFVSEQVKEGIRLPPSQTAVPMPKDETDVLFLNIKPYRPEEYADRPEDVRTYLQESFQPGDLTIWVAGDDKPLKKKGTIRNVGDWLKKQYKTAEIRSTDNEVHTILIIRPDKDTPYGDIFGLLQVCKAEKFTKVKVRALSNAKLTN